MRNRGSLLGLERLNREALASTQKGVCSPVNSPSRPQFGSSSTGGFRAMGKSASTGRLGGTADSFSKYGTEASATTPALRMTSSRPGMTTAAIERSARLHAKSLVSLRNDEHSRLNPPLARSNMQKPRQRDFPPMWDRATLSSQVQPTAFPCDPRDEKTWFGTTGYPLVYPGDHRHEWTKVEYHDRDYPRRPWKLTHTRCLAAEDFKNKVSHAADTFDLMRPQNTTAEVNPRAPRWRTSPMGSKLTVEANEAVKKAADTSAWETMRPRTDCPPPWAHVECPRARFVTAAVMSASPWQ